MRAFSAVSKNRIPLFIQEDYPELVNFLGAYYDWMQQGMVADADFLTVSDIDKTRDEFLKYFKDNHAKGLPDEIEANLREVLKHIREMYKTKGAENAIKFLFKAVFNENVDIFFPKTQMLHSSDATWIRKRSIVVNPNGKTTSFFKDVEGSIPFGRFYVIGATEQPNGNFLLDVSDIKGDLNLLTEVTIKGEEFQLVKQVAGITINTPGSGFVPGQYITLDNNVLLQVKEVTRGPITSINIVSGGTGYSGTEEVQFFDLGPLGSGGGTGAKATINQTAGVITSVTISNPGSYYQAPPEVLCESSSGTDAELEAVGNFSGLRSLNIIEGGFNLPVNPWTQAVSSANVTVKFANVVEHPGYFANQNGMLSTKTAYIQDEHYYQYYSYVIKSGINTEQYEKVLRLFAHPAGMRFFGTLLLEESVSSGSLEMINEFIVDIERVVSAPGLIELSVYELEVRSSASLGNPRYRVDLYKYNWLYESTFISRFKDFVISEWEANKTNNPFYYSSTTIQPDCIVNLLTIAPAGTSGFGLDGWGETRYG